VSEDTLSLYFQLRADEKADLEVVAKAALRWVATLRAAASTIDPNAKIRVELVDAAEGSLRLNTILDWVEAQLASIQEGSGKHPRLRALALALAAFVVTSTAQNVIDHLVDDLMGEPTMSLNAEDRALLEEMLENIRKNPEVESESRGFFQSLEADPSISGVGVAPDRLSPPIAIVPSTEFAERGGLWSLEEEGEERTLYRDLDVELIAPQLVPKKRAWTFKPEGLDEFTATMKDEKFLKALEQDHIRERLRTGIKMKIRLKIEEKKVGGAWTLKHGGRSVVEVLAPKVD